MTLIAREDTFIEDADGIRRKVAANSPIPIHLRAAYAEQYPDAENVPARQLSDVVVDEEASQPHPATQERQGKAKAAEGSRRQSAKKD